MSWAKAYCIHGNKLQTHDEFSTTEENGIEKKKKDKKRGW
jgi:hypothetical protein